MTKRLLCAPPTGLSLHYLGDVRAHDATDNDKIYSTRFLEIVTIESEGGFEFALELTVKAALAGNPMAEVPVTWRDQPRTRVPSECAPGSLHTCVGA